MHIYPLTFQPILKEKVWGGNRLADLGKDIPAGMTIGESWELSDLPPSVPEGQSVVAEGPLKGHSLGALMDSMGPELLGNAHSSEEGRFPLLIKFLDARENLSVQVHPDEAFAKAHRDAHLKSEAWVVLDAEEDAVIYKGLKPGTTADDLRAAIKEECVVELLNAVVARAGDCHYLPSGTCHALGAGVVVAEVQTPSDTTFRVYDWGRTGRDLHIAEAIECINFEGSLQVKAARPTHKGTFANPALLCKTDYFFIEEIYAGRFETVRVSSHGRPIIWIFLNGEATLQTAQGIQTACSTGTTVLFPAALNNASATFDQQTRLIRVLLP